MFRACYILSVDSESDHRGKWPYSTSELELELVAIGALIARLLWYFDEWR